MEKLNFTDQQRAVIDNRGGSLLVSAAAGTGKTRVLVERVMKKVAEEDCNICNFLIITYTTAAASELRSRIIEDLSKRSAEAPKNRHLRRQMSMARIANIGTIHSFCGNVIRGYAHELDISPDFRNIDESEIGIIKEGVLNDLIDARYSKLDKYPGFTELADTLSSGRKDDALVRTVLDAHNSLQSHPYPRRWINRELERLGSISDNDPSETPWGRYLIDEALTVTEYWLKEFIEAKGAIESDEKLKKAYGESWLETMSGLGKLRDALLNGSWDEVSRLRKVEFPRIGRTPEGYEYLKAGRDRCKGDMKKIQKTFSLTSDQIFGDLVKSRRIIGAFLTLILDFDSVYDSEKRRKNVLDFNDLEHLALKVLVDEATGETTEAARDIALMYDEVLVDEFQDVNTVQDMIFTAITDKNLFVVGDVKQSIYRFRLADPTIFMDYYKKFPDWANAEEGKPRKVLLSRNFRSNKNILHAVNFVFQNVMKSEFCGMDYTEREYLVPGREQEDEDTPVELCVLDQTGFTPSEKAEARDIEPRFVAQRVRKLIEAEGYSPGDIVILLRSISGKAWRYERELKRQGIPTALGGSDFFHSREIMSLTAALDIIDNPTRDVSLITAMSSPLFGFTPDELAEIRCRNRGGTFFDALSRFSEENQKCGAFLETLKKLRNIAPDISVENLLWQVLEETDALSVYGAMENGNIRRENIMRLLEYAGAYEAKGYRGLFRFLEMFRDAGEKGKLTGPEISPNGGVRIMSIHSSKGLEFPVAILADLSKEFNKEDLRGNVLLHPRLGVGIRLRDMERKISYSTMPRDAIAEKISSENRQEELRILYVAMTRAAKKLIMTCTLKDAEKELTGLHGKASYPLSPYVIGNVKNMSEWILLPLMLCPEKKELGIEGDSFQESINWDVKLAPCSSFMEDTQAPPAEVTESGIETEDIQDEVQYELVDKISERVYFEYPYGDSVDLPSKLTATELKSWQSEAAAEDAENITRRKITVHRPSFVMERDELTGAERGTAAHLVMQFADFSRCDSIDGISREIKRLESLRLITERQAEAVDPQMLMSFFNSPLGRQVLTSRSFTREFKFSLLVPAEKYYHVSGEDKILLQGVIDCFFETDEGLTIVDFKTDYVNRKTVEEKAASYAPQLDVYAYALSRITGKKVLHKYLFFFAIGQAVELP